MSTADIIDSSNQQQMKYGAGGTSAVLSGSGGAGVEEDYQFEAFLEMKVVCIVYLAYLCCM